MLIVAWYFKAIFVAWGCVEGPELGLIDESGELLLMPGKGFEAFPSWCIKEVVVLGIYSEYSTCDWIISSNDL